MTAISGLTQTDPTANIAAGNKVFFEPAVLTVRGKSQYRDDEISFVEISNFWSLPQNFVYNDAPRQPGTNPSDGNLHPGDVGTFTLNLNPKRGQNAKPGAFYANIGSVTGANGQQPIAAQQAAPQQAPRDEWAGEPPQQAAPTLSVDQRISKAQAWNGSKDLYKTYLILSDEHRKAMVEEAEMNGVDFNDVVESVWQGWKALKDGKVPFVEDEPGVEDTENPAEELDQQAQQHMAEMQPPAEEDIENVPW
jgi:hypothetical protein